MPRDTTDDIAAPMRRMQPIETAPSDRFVLIAGPSGYSTTPYRFEACHRSNWGDRAWRNHSNDRFTDGGPDATHWCELPLMVTVEEPIIQPVAVRAVAVRARPVATPVSITIESSPGVNTPEARRSNRALSAMQLVDLMVSRAGARSGELVPVQQPARPTEPAMGQTPAGPAKRHLIL